ncbi:MAG TPA: dockerin type I repeat-containing protein [Phycisphaerae bacterium]|nr:dockerin type I repeat-containing protein [Phycisphaerae bacterium]
MLASSVTPSSAIDFQVRTVVLSGDSAPGFPDGTVFGGPEYVDLNASGHVAFGDGYAIWSDTTGEIRLVARNGIPAPGAPAGENFHLIDIPIIADTGRVGFLATIFGFPEFRPGLWAGDSAYLIKVALVGTLGISQIGPVNAVVLGSPAINCEGATAFFASLFGTPVVMKESLGQLSILAQSGMSAPGTTPTSSFSSFGRTNQTINPALNDDDEAAFYARLNSSAPTRAGIWSERGGSLQLVIRAGMPAPGTESGVSFLEFSDPRINDAAETAFAGVLTGSGVSTENDTGIWSELPQGLALVARENSQASGLPTGVLYGSLENAPVINHSGRVAFTGRLKGSGISASNDSAMWSGSANELDLVAWEGSAIPAGGTWSDFPVEPEWAQGPAMNAIGIVAFTVGFSGVSSGGYPASVWMMYPNGHVNPVLRQGDMIEVRPGDFRVVETAYSLLTGGGQDGRRNALNDAGEIGITAEFTDGTAGVLVVSVLRIGDINSDGDVDVDDIPCMLAILVQWDNVTGCGVDQADANEDGIVDSRDLEPFVELILGD